VKQKTRELVTTGTPKHSGIPCTMVLRLIRVLLGVPGLLATVALGHLSGLDPSVGRSGPHDFTVRAQLPLACGIGASIASCSNVRGDWPNAPPTRIRMRRDNHNFRKNGREIFGGAAL
jgi:hypothetical protein